MKKTQINTAARAYALEELGEAQFKSNKDAVRSITDNFKAGVAFILKVLKPMDEPTGQDQNYQKVWNNFWKEDCTNPDGSINVDQVKRELADYKGVMDEVSIVYDTLTGGNISKPNTMASAVISEVERIHQEEMDELEKELASEDDQTSSMPPVDTLVRARPGDMVQTTIQQALELVASPATAYAYFQHNGVIVEVDKNSTLESAFAVWKGRFSAYCQALEAASK